MRVWPRSAFIVVVVQWYLLSYSQTRLGGLLGCSVCDRCVPSLISLGSGVGVLSYCDEEKERKEKEAL